MTSGDAFCQAVQWPQGETEEELFGAIITNDANPSWTAALVARDGATTGNQPGYIAWSEPVNYGGACDDPGDGTGHHNQSAEWGWYEVGSGPAQCKPSLNQAENWPEGHRLRADAFPPTREAHCIRAGRFNVELTNEGVLRLHRPVDFLPTYNGIAGPGWNYRVTKDDRPISGTAVIDVVVDFDEVTTNGPHAVPVVELSPAESLSAPAWTAIQPQQGVYRAPSNFWIRASAAKSTTTANPDRVLVRFFWDRANPAGSADRTNFGHTQLNFVGFVRGRLYATPGQRDILVHLVQPYNFPAVPGDETSANYGDTLRLTLDAYTALTATISQNPSGAVIVGHSITFSDADVANSGATPTQWRWEFGAGEGVLDYSTSNSSVVYSFVSTGTKTVTVRKKDANGYVVVRTALVTVNPQPPPSGLVVSAITSSGATLSWTNGDNQATTTVQQRVNGTTPWTTAANVGAGVTTYPLTGLTSCTTYDANLYHTSGGVNSANYTVLQAFRTIAASGACPPANFQVEECATSVAGGKTYVTYTVAWERGEFSIGSLFEIGQAETNNPASAAIVKSGSSVKTGTTLGPYLSSNNPPYTLWFWVRHKLSNGQTSAWVALLDNPLDPTDGCAL